MIFERSAPIAMSDGLQLRINIYRPETEGRFPVVMIQGPYTKDAHLKDLPFYRRPGSTCWQRTPICSGARQAGSSAGRRWIRSAGFPTATSSSTPMPAAAALRRATSTAFRRARSRTLQTLITWASRQAWSNGKVGLLGISYYAISQWQVAARQAEGLAAIIPWEGAFDHYRELSPRRLIQQRLSDNVVYANCRVGAARQWAKRLYGRHHRRKGDRQPDLAGASGLQSHRPH